MKKLIFTAVCLLAAFTTQYASAQARVAYVDTDFILQQMDEYKSAQKQLDDVAEQWKKEIKQKEEAIDKAYAKYQAEWVLLPEEDRVKRENEITQMEKEKNEFVNQKFGPEGELFKKRQQLIRPIQDKVFDAVQQLAKESAVDIILDKAGATTMLYTNAKYDRSEEVLEILGVAVKEENKK
jgi:outer membrane protein